MDNFQKPTCLVLRFEIPTSNTFHFITAVEDTKEAFETDPDEGDDDVFVANTNDKFGTLKANTAINKLQENRMDYRESKGAKSGTGPGVNNSPSDELAITDEFLKLLEDFQSKSYSAKEMELLFENWKRKADLQDFKVC